MRWIIQFLSSISTLLNPSYPALVVWTENIERHENVRTLLHRNGYWGKNKITQNVETSSGHVKYSWCIVIHVSCLRCMAKIISHMVREYITVVTDELLRMRSEFDDAKDDAIQNLMKAEQIWKMLRQQVSCMIISYCMYLYLTHSWLILLIAHRCTKTRAWMSNNTSQFYVAAIICPYPNPDADLSNLCL